jgi:hypothetical protein
LAKLYPNVPWIVPYFVRSSFPAFFGHFTSEEYLLAGQKFVESHIKDRLAPQLVGTYLMHCFLFQDRLLEALFSRVARSETEIAPDDLPSVFFDAFAACTSYFSASHCHVVALLRREDERLAIAAVFDHFLYEVVRLWSLSPIFVQMDFDVSGLHAPDEFVFLERLKATAAKRECVLTRMPQTRSVQFYGGVKFCLSAVDAALTHRFVALATPRKTFNRRTADVATAISDAFQLRTRYTHFPPSTVSAPPLADNSSELALKKLEEHKAFHDFLFTWTEITSFPHGC